MSWYCPDIGDLCNYLYMQTQTALIFKCPPQDLEYQVQPPSLIEARVAIHLACDEKAIFFSRFPISDNTINLYDRTRVRKAGSASVRPGARGHGLVRGYVHLTV